MIFCQYLLRNFIYYPLFGQFLVPAPGTQDWVPSCTVALEPSRTLCFVLLYLPAVSVVARFDSVRIFNSKPGCSFRLAFLNQVLTFIQLVEHIKKIWIHFFSKKKILCPRNLKPKFLLRRTVYAYVSEHCASFVTFFGSLLK